MLVWVLLQNRKNTRMIILPSAYHHLATAIPIADLSPSSRWYNHTISRSILIFDAFLPPFSLVCHWGKMALTEKAYRFSENRRSWNHQDPIHLWNCRFLSSINHEFYSENILHTHTHTHTQSININKSHLLDELSNVYNLLPTITQYNWCYY